MARFAAALAVAALLVLAFAPMTSSKAYAASDDVTAITIGEDYTVTIREAGGSRMFSVTPDESGYYMFCSNGDSDTYAYLYDSDMELLCEDDDSGTDFNASIVSYLVAGETYYLEFEFLDSDETGRFTISTSQLTPGQFASDEANEIELDGSSNIVYYVFSPESDGIYTFTLVGSCSEYLDAELTVTDSGSESLGTAWVWVDEEGGEDSASATMSLVAGDTYLVQVSYTTDGATPTSLTAYVESTEVTEIDLSTGYTYEYASSDGDFDGYLSFTAPGTGLYVLTLSGTATGDFYACAEIYDSSWSWLSYDVVEAYDGNLSFSDSCYLLLEEGETYYINFYGGSLADDDTEVTASISFSLVEAQTVDITSDCSYTVVTEDGYYGGETYLTFTPSQTGFYTFTLTGSSDDDIYAYAIVYDSDWTSSGYLYDYDTGGIETYVLVPLAAGETYYIDLYVDMYSEDEVGEVELTVAECDYIDLTDVGSDTLENQGYESFYNDYCYIYTAPASGTYILTVSVDCDDYAETYMDVYDSSLVYLDSCYAYHEGDDEPTEDCIYVELEEGETYFLNLYAYVYGIADITVSVEAVDDSDYEDTPAVVRLNGKTRYQTMAAIIEAYCDDGSCEYAIVASGKDFPDALAASYAAGVLDAPVVITTPSALSDEAAEQIERIGASTVYVIGGESAVSAAVVSAIESIDGVESVERVSGTNRYETASAVYDRFSSLSTTISGARTAIIAYGKSFADALCASPLSYASEYPILLVKTDEIPDSTLELLQSGDFDSVVIVGGEGVVSAAIEQKLDDMDISVTRLAGTSRYATSIEIADYAIGEGLLSAEVVSVATGASFPDALVGGAFAGSQEGVVLLAAPGDLSQDKNSYLDSFLDEYSDQVETIYIFGGTNAVYESLQDALEELMGVA